jgi:dynein heavy chain, axonemal
MGYFEQEVEYWQQGLSAISDTVSLMAEVSKTWSFLINLFLYSEEVKIELPTYSEDFVQIDKEVKALLKNSKNCDTILEFCI